MECANEAKKHRGKQRVIILCVLLVLVCVAGWWLYMETHFSGETSKVITTDEKTILSEMPQVALTQTEKNFSETVFEIPAIRQALADGETREVPLEDVANSMAAVVPADAEQVYVSVLFGHSVNIDLWYDDFRLILEYSDTNADGSADTIRKTIGLLQDSGDNRAAKTLYIAEYVVALGHTWYEKQTLQHEWFSFLDMP